MSPRHSTTRANHIEYSYWLTFRSDGGMSFSRGEPSLSPNERAMRCSATLPLSIFRTPQLRATITVAADGSSDVAIDVAAAEAALSQALGVTVRVEQADS